MVAPSGKSHRFEQCLWCIPFSAALQDTENRKISVVDCTAIDQTQRRHIFVICPTLLMFHVRTSNVQFDIRMSYAVHCRHAYPQHFALLQIVLGAPNYIEDRRSPSFCSSDRSSVHPTRVSTSLLCTCMHVRKFHRLYTDAKSRTHKHTRTHAPMHSRCDTSKHTYTRMART